MYYLLAEAHMAKLFSICLLVLLLPALVLAKDDAEVSTAEPDANGVQRVEISGGSYYFKPDHIVVQAGLPVELLLTNESTIVPHSFVLKAPEAGIDIDEDLTRSTKILRFTPTRPGKYKFHCDRKFIFSKSHKEKGMEGTLEVIQ